MRTWCIKNTAVKTLVIFAAQGETEATAARLLHRLRDVINCAAERYIEKQGIHVRKRLSVWGNNARQDLEYARVDADLKRKFNSEGDYVVFKRHNASAYPNEVQNPVRFTEVTDGQELSPFYCYKKGESDIFELVGGSLLVGGDTYSANQFQLVHMVDEPTKQIYADTAHTLPLDEAVGEIRPHMTALGKSIASVDPNANAFASILGQGHPHMGFSQTSVKRSLWRCLETMNRIWTRKAVEGVKCTTVFFSHGTTQESFKLGVSKTLTQGNLFALYPVDNRYKVYDVPSMTCHGTLIYAPGGDPCPWSFDPEVSQPRRRAPTVLIATGYEEIIANFDTHLPTARLKSDNVSTTTSPAGANGQPPLYYTVSFEQKRTPIETSYYGSKLIEQCTDSVPATTCVDIVAQLMSSTASVSIDQHAPEPALLKILELAPVHVDSINDRLRSEIKPLHVVRFGTYGHQWALQSTPHPELDALDAAVHVLSMKAAQANDELPYYPGGFECTVTELNTIALSSFVGIHSSLADGTGRTQRAVACLEHYTAITEHFGTDLIDLNEPGFNATFHRALLTYDPTEKMPSIVAAPVVWVYGSATSTRPTLCSVVGRVVTLGLFDLIMDKATRECRRHLEMMGWDDSILPGSIYEKVSGVSAAALPLARLMQCTLVEHMCNADAGKTFRDKRGRGAAADALADAVAHVVETFVAV